jgi:hypothetical protein
MAKLDDLRVIATLRRKSHCLYRHYDRHRALLYVGISLSAVQRLDGHHRDSHWFDEIATITIERFSNREKAEAAEKKAIIEEKPLHNVLHSLTAKKHHMGRSPMTQHCARRFVSRSSSQEDPECA